MDNLKKSLNNIIKFAKNVYMNKLILMKNPLLFQGEKYLKENKDYFEGWYLKITNVNYLISSIL